MLKARQFRSPIIVALMGDALLLRGGEQILEIGTGSG